MSVRYSSVPWPVFVTDWTMPGGMYRQSPSRMTNACPPQSAVPDPFRTVMTSAVLASAGGGATLLLPG